MAQHREEKLNCILHIGSNINDSDRLFTDKHWQSVKNAYERRMSKNKSSKYKSIWDKPHVT